MSIAYGATLVAEASNLAWLEIAEPELIETLELGGSLTDANIRIHHSNDMIDELDLSRFTGLTRLVVADGVSVRAYKGLKFLSKLSSVSIYSSQRVVIDLSVCNNLDRAEFEAYPRGSELVELADSTIILPKREMSLVRVERLPGRHSAHTIENLQVEVPLGRKVQIMAEKVSTMVVRGDCHGFALEPLDKTQ